MAKSFEAQSGNKNENSLVRLYKMINKIGLVAFGSVGLITDSEPFLALAAVNGAELYGTKKIQEWNRKRKTSKGLGKVALSN
jgi:hypothetical protein